MLSERVVSLVNSVDEINRSLSKTEVVRVKAIFFRALQREEKFREITNK